MSTWKLVKWTLGICLVCIAIFELINRLMKYRSRVTKELFRLDALVKTCPNEDLDKVWGEVFWFDVSTRMTNTQMAKMLAVMSYIQGRRSQFKHDTNLSKATRSQAAPPSADHSFTD